MDGRPTRRHVKSGHARTTNGFLTPAPPGKVKEKGARGENDKLPVDELREYIEGKRRGTAGVDGKIVALLSKSARLVHGLRATQTACPLCTDVRGLLNMKVCTVAELEEEVVTPLMEHLHGGRLIESEPEPFSFINVFALYFFEHFPNDASTTTHLALMSELLITHFNNKNALYTHLENIEKEKTKAASLEELNEQLITQACALDKNFANAMSGEEGPKYADTGCVTDPLPPDPILTTQVNDMHSTILSQRSAHKMLVEKLKAELVSISSALAKSEARYDVLLEETKNAAPKLKVVDTDHASAQTDAVEAHAAVFEDALNFELPPANSSWDPVSPPSSPLFQPGLTSLDGSSDSLLALSRAVHFPVLEIPPMGRVALVFTDIQSSTYLWNVSPTGMRQAIRDHNSLMRAAIKRFNGYEVKTEGDAFMVSFHNCMDACRWCCESQVELQNLEWPEEVLGIEDTTDTLHDDEGTVVFRGLRIRMGIHVDEPLCEEDPTTRRMDYFGPVVNFAARVSSKGRGGEIVMSVDAYNEVAEQLQEDSTKYIQCGATIFEHKVFELKGFSDGVFLYHIFPHALVNRRFYFKADPPPAAPVIENKIPAPVGDISLVFTDIQSSTYLWNQTQEGMITSIALHNEHLRALMLETNGYEVKTEGDAFMIAFEYTEDAAKWCMQSQMILLSLEWPSSLLELDVAAPVQTDYGGYLWRGVRVRMGIHAGWPLCQTDPTTGRMDYFGPVVNKAARVSGCGRGGETVVSIDAAQRLEPLLDTDEIVEGGVMMWTLPAVNLKGFSDEEVLQAIVPTMLSDRIEEFVQSRETPEAPKVVEQELSSEQKKQLEELEQRLLLVQQTAPQGEVTLACVTSHTVGLWNTAPSVMVQAVDLLSSIYEGVVQKYNGYVVSSSGDTLVCAFQEPKEAVQFSMEVHLGALEADWPEGLLVHKEAALIEKNEVVLWKGLRIKIAMLTGSPQVRTDPYTLRMDYYGPVMTATTKLMRKTKPGETLAVVVLEDEVKQLVHVVPTGETIGDGVSDAEVLQLLPLSLQGRTEALQSVKAHDDGKFEQLGTNKAPTGEVSVVFTEVESAATLWADVPDLMQEATAIKTKLFAKHSKQHAYHVMHEGDASLFAFPTVRHALRWCLQIQLGMAAEWPDGLEEHPCCETEYDADGNLLRKGLRLMMACASGPVLTDKDTTTGRVSYKGNIINKAARILRYVSSCDIGCEPGMLAGISETSLQMIVPGGATITREIKVEEDLSLVSIHPNSLKRQTSVKFKRSSGVKRNFFVSDLTQSQQEMLGQLEVSIEDRNSRARASRAAVLEQFVVCYDFIDCYNLWKEKPHKMRLATAVFKKASRTIIGTHNGAVCRRNADAYIVAFETLPKALAFCHELQTSLLLIPWPAELGDEPTRSKGTKDIVLWSGPRVRMALTKTLPVYETNPDTGGRYMCGPLVTSVCSGLKAARGGEILCTEEFWDTSDTVRDFYIDKVEEGYSLTPYELGARFPMLKPPKGDILRFSQFVARPCPYPKVPSYIVVVQTPVDAGARCLGVLSTDKGTLMVFEGSCLVFGFVDGGKLLKWLCEVQGSMSDAKLLMKFGAHFSSDPKGPLGTDKATVYAEGEMRTASKLCEQAALGQFVLSDHAVVQLDGAIVDMGYSTKPKESGGHVLLIDERTHVKGPLPGPWFHWHIAKGPKAVKKPKEQSKVQRILRHTYNQRVTIIGGTLAVLQSLERDAMACYDEELVEKPLRAAEAFHILSIHYRTMGVMLEGPTSVHFIDEMKSRAGRLNQTLREKGLVQVAARNVDRLKQKALKMWLSYLRLAPPLWGDEQQVPLDRSLVAMHELAHSFLKILKKYLSTTLGEGVDPHQYQQDFLFTWLDSIEGFRTTAFPNELPGPQRLKQQIRSICSGSATEPKAAFNCVGSIYLKALHLVEPKVPQVVVQAEKEKKEVKKKKEEKEKEKEEKVDLNKLLMGALLPGGQKKQPAAKVPKDSKEPA